MFVLAALMTAGLAQASQTIDIGAPAGIAPEQPLMGAPASPASSVVASPQPVVIVDPACAFDGSGCQQATQPAPAAPAQEVAPQPTAPGQEPQPASASQAEPAEPQPANGGP